MKTVPHVQDMLVLIASRMDADADAPIRMLTLRPREAIKEGDGPGLVAKGIADFTHFLFKKIRLGISYYEDGTAVATATYYFEDSQKDRRVRKKFHLADYEISSVVYGLAAGAPSSEVF